MKFGRIFTMVVEGKDRTHTLQSPLTCRFRVNSNSLMSCGMAVFQLYNLSAESRNDIYKDAYSQSTYKRVAFEAGYSEEPTTPVIFTGNVLTAFSYRQGSDWITEIQALDGGFAIDNGTIKLTVPSPYNLERVLTTVVQSMPHVKLGLIGSFDITNTRGISFSGSPWDLICQLILPLQGMAFINNEKVYILRQWEYLNMPIVVERISAETGMIGTPRMQESIVKVRMIYEPRLEINQSVELQTLESRMNGDYKILGLIHAGTISGSVCETLETEATLFQPDRALEAA